MNGKVFKRAGTAVLLTAAFAAAFAAPANAALTSDHERGPDGAQQYSQLQDKVSRLVALHHGADAIDASRIARDATAVEMDIILNKAISERDAATLIATLRQGGVQLTANLANLDGKTVFLHDCQKDLFSGNAGSRENLARAVSDCAGAKYENEVVIKGNAIADEKPVLPAAPVAQEKPKAPATAQQGEGIGAKIAKVFNGVSTASLGLGLVIGTFGVGGILGLRRLFRKKPDAQNLQPQPSSTPPAPKRKIVL